MIRLVCAWCGRVLRDGAEPTSHGICEECFGHFAAHIETTLSEQDRKVKVLPLKGA